MCAPERSARARAVRPGPFWFATRSLGALKFCIPQCVARLVLGPSASELASRALVSVRVAPSLVPWSSRGCRAVAGREQVAWDVAAAAGTLGSLCLSQRSPGPIGVFLGGGQVVEMWLAGARWRGVLASDRVVSGVGLCSVFMAAGGSA